MKTGMRPWALLAGLAALAGAPAAVAQPEDIEAIQEARASLENLAWLSGHWEEEREPLEGAPPSWTEEIWGEPRGAMMLGWGRRGQGVRIGSWEFLRIEGDGGGVLSLHAQVEGDPAVAFRLASASGTEVVFENADHDYPQRIAYRRSGDRLTATISLMDGSRAQSATFRLLSGSTGSLPGR